MSKHRKKKVDKVLSKSEEPRKRHISPNLEKYIIIPILIILILLVAFFIFNSVKGFLKEERTKDKLPTCGDGSFYDTCSIRKPYMCERGVLIERSRYCGCVIGFDKKEDRCVSPLTINEREIGLPYLFNGIKREIDLSLYEGLYDYLGNVSRSITYNAEEKPFRVDFKFKKINEENQKQMLAPLIVSIQNMASSKEDQARIAISLVQNIPFSQSSKNLNLMNKNISYSRYPYEVLYEDAGVCGEKSELLAFLLKELGFGTVLFYNRAENHEAVGIACPAEESYWNSGYCFVETSASSIISDDEITYAGNVKLYSKPEIMFISPGISLSKDLQEYKDAKLFDELRKKVEAGKRLSSSETQKLGELDERYGLVEIYNA